MEFVWITKYALTRGILRCAKSQVRISDGYLYYNEPGMKMPTQVVQAHWFMNQQEAEERVRQIVARKKASLERQLRCIDSLQRKAITVSYI